MGDQPINGCACIGSLHLLKYLISFCTVDVTIQQTEMIKNVETYHLHHTGPLLCRQEVRKEGNILFNDALNTFYLRLYGVRHMVKDHSDTEREKQLLPSLQGLLFPININDESV